MSSRPAGPGWLDRRLGGDGPVVIMDGGMGTELERRGVPMDGRVWSGRAVLEHPDAVREAHADFVRAGAEVIVTNTFAAGRHMLEPAGLGEHVAAINRDSVRLAREAVDLAAPDHPVAVVGSLCEWTTGNDDGGWHTAEGVARGIGEQAALLADAGCDALALEMCQHPVFSAAAAGAALEAGLPVWAGISCRRSRETGALGAFDRPGRDIVPVIEVLAGLDVAVMTVMHSPVPDVPAALDLVRAAWDGPVGVYPESGYFEMPNWRFVDVIGPDALAREARHWVAHGVRMVGGCCGLGPAHVRALAETFAVDSDAP